MTMPFRPFPFRAVFFDVDGVLVDSLPQHLAFCADRAQEYGLRISIPDAASFRRQVAGGLRVSPMREMFLSLGFPPVLAERAAEDYRTDFARRYQSTPFPGVERMLVELEGRGCTLGLVTANTRDNVERMLGDTLGHFDPRWRYYADTVPLGAGKRWCLDAAARCLELRAGDGVFIGDQPADTQAAAEAGWNFVGVTFGWGILREAQAFPTVDRMADITEALTSWAWQR
jgi:phosphoglycolate phosphatase